MGRLKAVAPRLGGLKPTLGYLPGDEKAADRQRNVMGPWRAWYKTQRWVKLRQAVLLRDLYTCAMCQRVSSKGMVIDHIKPHRGSAALFWDEANLQVLCGSPCHSKHKQTMEQAVPMGQWQ